MMNQNNAPLARTHDPLSSHIANSNIKADKRLADLIMEAVDHLYCDFYVGITDDEIHDYVEQETNKRQQRNVIARARGLLERDGRLVRVETSPRVAVVPGKGYDNGS
jgi:hypothetical protein